MSEPDDARCPGCGAAVNSRYCPQCGARTGWTDLVPPNAERGAARSTPAQLTPTPAPAVQIGPPAAPVGPPTVQGEPATVQVEPVTEPMRAVAGPVPPRAVPEMFSTEFLPVAGPARAWSETPDHGAAPASSAPGLFPGWTGMHPAVPIGGAAGVLAPRPERRRKAVYAVLGIAAATVIVLLAALLIAPSWRGTGGTADKVGPGPVVSSPAGTATTTPPTTPTASSPGGAPGSAGDGAPVRTVTVTAATPTAATPTAATGTAATPTAATGTAATGTAATGTAAAGRPTPAPRSTTKPSTARPSTARSTPKPTAKPTPKPTAKPTPKPSTTAPALPLGVPQRDISCSAGYIVQLASELDTSRFKARVAALKSAGQVPAGALAADSTRSCRIFTSQVNTLVLYSGPYRSKYDGCAARLAGPADAYIKGGNADSAREYVSCLCPAAVAALPRYTAVGQQGVWVGELQRVLGNRLNIDVGDLAGNWGRFTAGTQAAVRNFQQAAQLPSTGVVDARTWSALQSAEC